MDLKLGQRRPLVRLCTGEELAGPQLPDKAGHVVDLARASQQSRRLLTPPPARVDHGLGLIEK